MSMVIRAICPECGSANMIDLNLYPQRQVSGLYDMCNDCKKVYCFDIETVKVAVPFSVINSKLQ